MDTRATAAHDADGARRIGNAEAEMSAEFRLSVWRTVHPDRRLVLRRDEDASSRPVNPDNLQEEVYAWSLHEDPFAGIADDHIRENLNRLLARLEASHPPSDRGFAVIDEFVEKALKAVESGDAVSSEVQDPRADRDGTPDKMNALLALALHLDWLSRCFADRPGISVSIR